MLREQHLHETLWQLEAQRARRGEHPRLAGGSRRSMARAAARAGGRALIGLGARLLRFGGEGVRIQVRAARAQADLAHYTAPRSYSRN